MMKNYLNSIEIGWLKKSYGLALSALFVLLFSFQSNAQCDIEVSVNSASWGDATTWTLTDNDGTTVLSGGPYGNGYSDVQTLNGANNGPYTFFIETTLGDNVPSYSVSLDAVVVVSGSVAGPGTFTEPGIAPGCVPPPPPACDIEVSVNSASWGDATTWTLTDNDGATVLSGGPYGNGYSDVQTLNGADNGPYTFFIESTLGDNVPSYSVSLDAVVVTSGSVAGPGTFSEPGIAPGCTGTPPPPPSCDLTFDISSASWGDGTTWTVTDNDGATVLSGGPYGNGYADSQTLTGANNGPYTWTIVSTLGDNSPNYTVSSGATVLFTGNVPGATTANVGPINCPAPPPPPSCDLTFDISSASWGDGTTWTVTDNDGATVLSGGPYGNGYADSQTLTGANNGPYTWTIVSTLSDNSPNYTVSSGATVLFSGNVPPATTVNVGPITCPTAPPPGDCGSTVYDEGGPAGNYNANSDVTETYCPDSPAEILTVTFNSFQVESGWDALYIHDGATTADPLFDSGNPATSGGFPAGGWYGTTNPGPFSASVPGGCITFNFRSDGSVNQAGWEATISCFIPVCGSTVYDEGGPSGTYNANSDVTETYCADTPGDILTITFVSFQVETGWDALYIHDGATTADPLFDSGNPATSGGFPAGGWYGATNPGPFSSTNPAGCLTLNFRSDGSVQQAGWEANLTCAAPPACDAPTVTPNSTSVDCIAGTYTLTLDIGADGDAADYDVFLIAQGPNPNPGPYCDQAQGSAGFPSDLGCEAAVCGDDSFCCTNTWDGICATSAATDFATECAACQSLVDLNVYVGTFTGGTNGIVVTTANIGEEVEVLVTHNSDPACDQTVTFLDAIVCGCTDAAAINFDAAATDDDGSCVLPPANDDCVNAQTLNVVQWPASTSTLGTLAGAFGSGLPACAGTSGTDVFYGFTAASTNHYILNLNAFGGFNGVMELWDGCTGSLVECFAPGPDCSVSQGSPGFPSDPGCEAAICAADPFCCNNTWDGVCGSDAALEPACAGCVGGTSASPGLALDLPAGDYIIRVRNLDGGVILDNSGQFLIGVQSFPTAKVQDNPANILYACNQSGFQLEDIIGATPQTTPWVLDYEWLIAEVGAGTSNIWQRGEPNYSAIINWLGMEYGKLYNVYVRVLVDHPVFGPTWGVFQVDGANPNAPGASECTVEMSSNVTPTELRPNYTPTNAQGNFYRLCDLAVAFNVYEAEDFRWRFDPDTDPLNGNEIIYQRNAPNPGVRLSWVGGLIPGNTYNVAVEVQVGGDWSGYSTVLPITLALPPNDVEVRSQYCGITYPSASGVILAQSVCAADNYEWEFDGPTLSTATTGNYALNIGAASVQPPLQPGVYNVRVKVTQEGIPGDFGPVCVITIGGPGAPGDTPAALRELAENSATLFPNPNAGDEVRMELDGLSDGNHEVMIQIYDSYGKLIQTEGFGHTGTNLSRVVRFNSELATGMYLVQIAVDGERYATERLIVK